LDSGSGDVFNLYRALVIIDHSSMEFPYAGNPVLGCVWYLLRDILMYSGTIFFIKFLNVKSKIHLGMTFLFLDSRYPDPLRGNMY